MLLMMVREEVLLTWVVILSVCDALDGEKGVSGNWDIK